LPSPLRVGLLSTARINKMIIDAAGSSDQVDIVAVASRDRSRAVAYARAHSIPTWHGSYAALLADSGVDAVYISLPNRLHHQWTLTALQAGKHVLCEKPYSRRPTDVEVAFAAARDAGLVVMEAFMYVHHPQLSHARQLIGDGAIGPLRAIHAVFSHPLGVNGQAGDIRLDPALDGGATMDVASYCISGCRYFVGEPTHVAAELVTGPSGVDIAAHATLRFAEDVVGQIEGSFAAPMRQRLELVGESGALILQSPWSHSCFWESAYEDAAYSPMLLRRERLPTETFLPTRIDAYRLEIEHFADVINGTCDQLLDVDDALGQARALDAIYRAAREHRTLQLA
jgi:D-xylose 1-dehydrogenase (NADP+, D-xylono-1,5-lactone-forming)